MIRKGTDKSVCATTKPTKINTSERYATAELNVTRVVAVLIDDCKSRIPWILIGIPKNGVIEGIDRFDTNLQAHSSRDRKSLVETEIEKIEVCGPDMRQCGRE